MIDKCLVCGKRAHHVHHWFTVGRYGDAAKVEENEFPICVDHHSEFHTTGRYTFMEKYKAKALVEEAWVAVKARQILLPPDTSSCYNGTEGNGTKEDEGAGDLPTEGQGP